jgi:hypothetical protein
MTSFSASPIAPPRRLPFPSITPYCIYVVLHLLIYIFLRNNILCILYSKYTPLTDTSLFSPIAFAKGFINCSKDIYLSG